MTIPRGFVSLGLVLLIVIGLAVLGGATWWANRHTTNTLDQAVGQTASTATENGNTQPSQAANAYANWRTYTNTYHGYSISYPPGAVLSGMMDWYSSTCVDIKDSSGKWYEEISTEVQYAQVPCGGTGTSATNYKATDMVTIDGPLNCRFRPGRE
jgi:hypothetical protein